MVWLLNESPQFTSARLKTYLFYFFKLLHKKNSSYGITENYLKNALTYDREVKKLLHKNYMVALVIERQDEKPGEIKDVIQREKPISYELGLDKYLSDVIVWDANNENLHIEELTSEEIEHLRQEFKNCIVKTGAEIKKNNYEHTILSLPVARNTYFLINASSSFWNPLRTMLLAFKSFFNIASIPTEIGTSLVECPKFGFLFSYG